MYIPYMLSGEATLSDVRMGAGAGAAWQNMPDQTFTFSPLFFLATWLVEP